MLPTIPKLRTLSTGSIPRRPVIKPPKPPQDLPPVLLPSLLLLASTTVTGYFLARISVTAFSYPKSPILLHHAFLPELLLIAALYNPIPQHLKPYIFIPPLLGAYYTLLGTSSTSSPIGAFGIGTYIAFHSFNALLLLLFQPPPPDRPSSLLDAVAFTVDFRGIGEKWQTRLPRERPGNWWIRRIVRLVRIYIWLDFLIWWFRVYDRDYHIPLEFGKHAQVPSQWNFPGVRNPEFPYSPADDPLPRGWSYPENPAAKMAMAVMLRTLRTVFHMTTIYSAFSGAQCALSIIFVGLGELVGYRKGWCARSAWPDPFGHWLTGDLGYGVKGFWSRAWHSMFRRIFTGPGIWLYPKDAPDSTAKMVAWLTTPFLVSAALHLMGVWTVAPHRGWGAVRFFVLQPVGMVLEAPLLAATKRRGGERYWWVWRTAVYLWALAWLTITCRGFFEEYRWNGLWWTEPLPVSLRVRYVDGKSWAEAWRWGGQWWRWAKDAAEGGVMGEWGVVVVE